MPTRRPCTRTFAAIAGLLGFATPLPAVTTEHVVLRTGSDLVALSATPRNDPLYTAAIHFWHGFGSGVYQTILATTNHEKLTPILYPTNPSPTATRGS